VAQGVSPDFKPQHCKIKTKQTTILFWCCDRGVLGDREEERGDGEGIWLMCFVYMYETEQ
jgi:hypothetical protein